VFAGAYQATLRQGAADQAAYAVPLDARITAGDGLSRPLDVATPAGYAATVPGVTVHSVLRISASVRANAVESRPVELIGVDPAALPLVHSWENVAGGSPTVLSGDAPEAGVPVTALRFPVAEESAGDLRDAELSAWLRLPDGRTIGRALKGANGVLTGDPVPPGARLVALTVTEEPELANRRLHRIGEGDLDAPIVTGTLRITVPGNPTGWAAGGPGEVTVDGPVLTVAYRFTGERVVVHAGADPAPVPVLVDPDTAALAGNGQLTLTVDTGTVPARIVGVIPRFPTAGSRFAVAAAGPLGAALDARSPGSGSVSELWLHAPEGRAGDLAAALAKAPYDRLTVDLREARETNLAGDPLARGATGQLVLGALTALLLGLVALVLLVAAERRDGSAEWYAWESDGVGPRTLRRSLFVRAASVVATAVPGGLLVGLALSLATTATVAVTAVGTAPVPPLAPAVGVGWIATVVSAGVAAGLVACALVASTTMRERNPRRPEGASA
jgi:hypothetical protein